MDEDLRTLDQLRQRFLSLSLLLQKQQTQILTSPTLPPWKDLSASQEALAAQLSAFQSILSSENKPKYLLEAHAHPTSAFPRAEEGLLTQLLRKRLEPEVVNWTIEARSIGSSMEEKEKEEKIWTELWSWAGPEANQIVRKIHGPSEEDEEEEDDDDDDDNGDENEEEDRNNNDDHGKDIEKEVQSEIRNDSMAKQVIQPMPLSRILKFANTGVEPI